MLLGIDHIVIAVTDLDTAASDYEKLGFTVVPGGRHPVGTHNCLISFADGSYIEIIAFYQANTAHRWWLALQKGDGFVDFCMQTNDLVGDTAKLRKAGVAIDDPVPWSRTRPDGYQLKWLLSLAREPHRGVAPFLIQDETPREERIPRQTAQKNNAVGIGAIAVAVDDLSSVSRWYEGVLGRPGESIERQELKAAGIRYQAGPHSLEFLKPTTSGGPIADWLHGRGPSPYSATLKSGSGTGSVESNLTHGAGLSFE